jgi:hypothetical protein
VRVFSCLRVCGRPGQVSELNLTNGLPELVKNSHDFSFLRSDHFRVERKGYLGVPGPSGPVLIRLR